MTNLLPPRDIPDLSSLHPLSEWAALLRSIGSTGSSDSLAHTLLVNCVRLLDAAIADYLLGRSEILAFHDRDPGHFALGYVFRATTHFESCIWHLERFIKHARALRSARSAEIDLKKLIPADASFLSQSSEKKITRLRHTLAHLEGAAQRGELARGTLIALMPLQEGLSISGHKVDWTDLAQWLKDAHACAETLAEFSPTTSSHSA